MYSQFLLKILTQQV